MEWFKVITEFIGTIVWPLIVLMLAMLFRKEIRSRLGAIKELKYPGGSVTLEVQKLEESVEKIKTNETKKIQSSEESLQIKFADPQLAIAQMRIDIEKEIFRLSWISLDNDNIKGWGIEKHIDELTKSEVMDSSLAENLRTFVRISNSIVHGVEVPDDVKVRSSSIGASLVAQLHYRRKVREMERDFDGHGLWHMHKHLSPETQRYYFWSAVASSISECDYSYEIYREAADRHNKKAEERGHRSIYVLQLDEFVRVLEFREKELLRLINVWHNPQGDTWKSFESANYWQWPPEWGNLGWKGPIIRERLSLYEAEDTLMQTRTALNRYRMSLIKSESKCS